MKAFLIFLATLCGSFGFSGQFTWTAANLDSSFSSGTGYLLEVPTEGAPTIQAIKDYIQQNGITAPEDTNITLVDSGSVVDDYGAWSIVNEIGNTTGNIAGNSYFVLIFNSDYTSFVISEMVLGNPGPLGEQVEIFGDYYSSAPADYWGNPIVIGIIPEPTALALLALGVAGVALRRRLR